MLNTKPRDAVQDTQGRTREAEYREGGVPQRGGAEHRPHERSAGVPGDERRGDGTTVSREPGQVRRGEAAAGEGVAEDAGREDKRDVLVTGDQVQAECAGE